MAVVMLPSHTFGGPIGQREGKAVIANKEKIRVEKSEVVETAAPLIFLILLRHLP